MHSQSGGFILQDARNCALFRMKLGTLMAWSAATPGISNHATIANSLMIPTGAEFAVGVTR
jgi:hypothetical protein